MKTRRYRRALVSDAGTRRRDEAGAGLAKVQKCQ